MHRHPRTLAVVCLSALLLVACGQDEPAVRVDTDEDRAEDAGGGLDGTEDAGDTDGGDVDAGDTGDAGTEADAGTALGAATDAAVADLAATAGADTSDVEVVTAETVTWSDGSLGCPEPGQMYTQALVPGYRVVLALDGDEVHYHGADGGAPQRCDAPQPPADSGT